MFDRPVWGPENSTASSVSFGDNMLNSTRGNMQRTAPSVLLATKENIQWEVLPCGLGEDICVDDWTVQSGSGRVRTQNFPYIADQEAEASNENVL